MGIGILNSPNSERKLFVSSFQMGKDLVDKDMYKFSFLFLSFASRWQADFVNTEDSRNESKGNDEWNEYNCNCFIVQQGALKTRTSL